jgi:hypothetical protein
MEAPARTSRPLTGKVRDNISMSTTDRAMMLGIRHRCGQEVQFWIPTYLVAPIIGDLHENEVLGLAGWMEEEGMLPEGAAAGPADLVAHLRSQMAPRSVSFIDVEHDASVCPSCGALLPWIDMVTEYVAGKRRGEY